MSQVPDMLQRLRDCLARLEEVAPEWRRLDERERAAFADNWASVMTSDLPALAEAETDGQLLSEQQHELTDLRAHIEMHGADLDYLGLAFPAGWEPPVSSDGVTTVRTRPDGIDSQQNDAWYALRWLSACIADLEDMLPEWSSIPELERYSFEMDWLQAMSGDVPLLDEAEAAGRLSPGQARHYRALLARIERHRADIERLNLDLPRHRVASGSAGG